MIDRGEIRSCEAGRCPQCLKYTSNYTRHMKDCYMCEICKHWFTDSKHKERCGRLMQKKLENIEKYWTCELCGVLVERRLRHIHEVHRYKKKDFRLVVNPNVQDEKEREELRKQAHKNKLRVNKCLWEPFRISVLRLNVFVK
jgi:rubredoxin